MAGQRGALIDVGPIESLPVLLEGPTPAGASGGVEGTLHAATGGQVEERAEGVIEAAPPAVGLAV